jgi:hypothetical protein
MAKRKRFLVRAAWNVKGKPMIIELSLMVIAFWLGGMTGLGILSLALILIWILF